MGLEKIMIKKGGVRIASGNNLSAARNMVAETATPEAYKIYEYVGGNPDLPTSWELR